MSIGDGGTPIGNPPFGAFSCAPAVVPYCDVPMQLDDTGVMGGLQLGANWQSGVLVLGAEAEFGWTNIEDSVLLNRPAGDQDIGAVEYDWYSTLTGRAGVAVDRTLLYAKGGVAFADVAMSAADLDNGQIYQGSFVADDGILTGWALGGGLEHALSSDVSVKAEYLYMDFGSATTMSADGDIYRYKAEVHSLRVGANFRLAPM
jgi:outer membrane immunogenic protein